MWSVSRFRHTSGQMQLGRTHSSQIHCSRPFILYILPEGPPRSEIVPRKSGICLMDSTSRRMLALLRLATNLPWCAEIVQKLHPPKHPRCILIECLIISYAGIGPRLRYFGCGSRVYGRSKLESICRSDIVGNGGLTTSSRSPVGCSNRRAFTRFDSVSMSLKFRA